jgi:hypothetical protein
VDKILRGADSADLPIQQPTQFRLSMPQSLLLRADDVIH